MNTPAHLIFAAAAFARPAAPGPAGAATRRRNLAALAGGLAPDLGLFVLVAWARFVQGHDLPRIFGQDYGSPLWQAVFRIDNSIPLWAALGAAALWLGRPALAVLAGAALLHLAFDLPLHHSDARPHFWPLVEWVFRSPISYWNPARHGGTVALVEGTMCLALAVVLWRRFEGRWARAAIAAALAAEAAPTVIWPWLLGPG
ncbi:cobalamin biosynthesis protein CobQ [Albimonas sp. CAU 1670]|uniref:cobalamin biosynthesis protein CobQ n=1 Tax=Albimonas sp. CAU 1670 TaxID=3032599 RepID=UPI0023DC070B|nr:cobalamin biosynthesis protein CobQ [Albimonas sp. CAU 1670]MDF2231203.1 cobalamin biosynthesis protein CobQ [Albimonas sp. CAU 1670]